MRIGDFDIELSAETSLEMLIVLAYYCAYDGSEAEAEQVRPLLEAKLEQCNDDTLRSQGLFALCLITHKPVVFDANQYLVEQPSENVRFNLIRVNAANARYSAYHEETTKWFREFAGVDYCREFGRYTVSAQISQLASFAYVSAIFFKNERYDDIKNIYNHITLRIFDHEPESVHTDGDEVNFEVDYGKLTVALSDMDLLNLILVDRYLFMNVPLGLGPDNSLNLTAELVRRSNDGDTIATAILAWFDLYFYREH
jgi:hypothetical protein